MQVKTIKNFGKSIDNHDIKITICEQNQEIAQLFAKVFADIDQIAICHGNILHLAADALVSPANSFGDMGGGLDKAIDDFFEGEAQPKIQAHIHQEFMGELPVGMASIIKMGYRQFPYLIVAPTMRVPGNVQGTINAYLAMRAVLVSTAKYNENQADIITHIAMTSLCTGVGGMGFSESGEQIRAAVLNVLYGGWKEIVHAAMAPYALGAKKS